MRFALFKFCGDETGAVTVDWVVLTGAIVGLGFVVLVPIAYSVDSSASVVSSNIAKTGVGYVSKATP